MFGKVPEAVSQCGKGSDALHYSSEKALLSKVGECFCGDVCVHYLRANLLEREQCTQQCTREDGLSLYLSSAFYRFAVEVDDSYVVRSASLLLRYWPL